MTRKTLRAAFLTATLLGIAAYFIVFPSELVPPSPLKPKPRSNKLTKVDQQKLRARITESVTETSPKRPARALKAVLPEQAPERKEPARVSGLVLTPSGDRAAFAGIDLDPRPDGAPPQLKADANGCFALEDLPPGRYTLRATHRRYFESESHTLTLVSGDDRDVILKLRPKRSLKLVVRDSQGNPVPYANVGLRPEQRSARAVLTLADEHGRVSFDDIRCQRYRVRVDLAGHAVEDIPVNFGDERLNRDLEVSLQRAARLSLKLTSQATGQVPSKALAILATTPPTAREVISRSVLRDGAVLFPRLKPGRYDLWVLSPHTNTQRLRVSLSEAEECDLGQISLSPRACFTVKVVDSQERPRAGLKLEARGVEFLQRAPFLKERLEARVATTNSAGQATFDKVDVGEQELSVSDGTARLAVFQRTQTLAGASVTLRLPEKKPGNSKTLEGVSKRPTKKP